MILRAWANVASELKYHTCFRRVASWQNEWDSSGWDGYWCCSSWGFKTIFCYSGWRPRR